MHTLAHISSLIEIYPDMFASIPIGSFVSASLAATAFEEHPNAPLSGTQLQRFADILGIPPEQAQETWITLGPLLIDQHASTSPWLSHGSYLKVGMR
jgi:hypothetical protein